MSSPVQEIHNKDCFCESCFWFKMENPEIVTDRINEFRDYAEEEFKNQ